MFIFFIFKKNDSLQLCINYKKLNLITIKNHYFLLLIDKTLNQLFSVSIFTQLDFKNVYYCIYIKEDNKWKTVFCTCYEYYEYQVVFFSLTNISIMFQVYINKTLSNLLNICCIVYLNDILIYSNLKKQHYCHICKVLEYLHKYRFYVKISKYFFKIDIVNFLNFIVSSHSI